MLILLLELFFTIIEANSDTYDYPIIGIDLGTTYSSVCILQNDTVEIIVNEYGSKTTPTVVALSNDEFLVGEDAKEQAIINPNNTFYDLKRLIGRPYFDPSGQMVKKSVTYSIIEQNNKSFIQVSKYKNESPKLFSIDYIQAKVLTKLKNLASSSLKLPIYNVVITVPIDFDDVQKQAIKNIARIAGLNVVRIISEPKAAAIAYGKNYEEKEKNIVVFDFGGGTLDVTVLKIKKDYFEDIAFGSEINLGGEDFDFNLVYYFTQQIKESTNINIKKNKNAMQTLKIEAQKVKEALSFQNIAYIRIKNLFEGYDFNYNITREKFEELNEELFLRVYLTLKSAYDESKLKKDQIAEVILVGGSSRIPKIQQIVEDFFQQIKIIKDKIQDELVCVGAAIYANQFTKYNRNRALEIKRTSISYGIELVGELMSIIIPKMSKYPLTLSKFYTTVYDYQPSVLISIFQGENSFTMLNNKIGEFELKGIQIAEKWIPQIQVTFSLDDNGMLIVTAVDLQTKSSEKNQIVITNLMRTSEEDLQQQIEDNKEEQHLQQQKLNAIFNLNKYLNHFLKELQSSKFKYLLNQAQYEEINQLISSSSQWVKEHEHDTNKKREDYEKELENLKKSIESILTKQNEDL